MIKSLLPSSVYNKIRLYNYFRRFISNKHSYFVKTGFIDAYLKGQPRDADGNPIPWMNYAVIDFFNKRLNNDINIFEYGSGFSTLYFADKVNQVTSVEYDTKWYEYASELTKKKKNVSIIFAELEVNYVETINNTGRIYNMIIIDGRDRVACAINAFSQLAENGVVVLDDSSRFKYSAIWDHYRNQGFKDLTFTGLKPTGFSIDSTTIFYRTNNILGI